MNRNTGLAVAVVLLLACGFVLFRWVANPSNDSVSGDPNGSLQKASKPAVTSPVNVPADGSTSARSEASRPSRSMPQDDPAGNSPSRLAMPPPTMSTQDLRRVAEFAKRMAEGDERHKAFHTAVVGEAPDPDWSPWAQSELTSALQRSFTGIDGLETAEVVCSRSICALTAVAHSKVITDGTDWQRVMGRVVNEPWFATHFNDTSTSMGSDERGMIYVTYFVRKP